jgi:hypothetical protein
MVVVEESPAETTQNLVIPEPTTRTAALSTPAANPAASPSPELDTDLASLFDDEHGLSLPDTFGPAAVHDNAGLDLDLTGGVADADVTAESGWGGGNSQLAPTQRAAKPAVPLDDTAEQLDLQALASSADGDEKLSQTLMEALTLLERDYEEELTASQVADLNKLRNSSPGDEDPIARTGTGSRKLR